MVVLHFNMQEEAYSCQVSFVYAFKTTCRPLHDIGICLITLCIEHTHAKILVSTVEHQMSRGDTTGEIVDHYWNLGYTSK